MALVHAPAAEMEEASSCAHSCLALATAVTGADRSHRKWKRSPRRIWPCQTCAATLPGARAAAGQSARTGAGPALGTRGRPVGRGRRALGLGVIGRTLLTAPEHWHPKPAAAGPLLHMTDICSYRWLAQHGGHERVAVASTRSSTSTSSGAGAGTRSAGRSRWRPRARRRPPHATPPAFHHARRVKDNAPCSVMHVQLTPCTRSDALYYNDNAHGCAWPRIVAHSGVLSFCSHECTCLH